MLKKVILPVAFLIILVGCKKEVAKTTQETASDTSKIEFAKGFSVQQNQDYKVIEVDDPWPEAEKSFRYALIPKEKSNMASSLKESHDAVIVTPVETLVVTSTTHIPALEALGALGQLVGFPDTKYISSLPARKLIQNGNIQELGQNEKLNTEITLALQPNVVVGFAINNENSSYSTLQKGNIPVVFNGDWVEQSPLGKAEWIKFFGALLGKEKEADSIFNVIKESYHEAKLLASKAREKPSVLSGALYKDVWYAPSGDSWATKFLEDANADYLYKDSEGSGSLSLSLESVLDDATEADYWVSPSQFTGYQEMKDANNHYTQFKAFKTKNVYTFAASRGPTGGLLYYELAPQRPDLVLKDLIKIFHPELLPDYNPYFFTPLQ